MVRGITFLIDITAERDNTMGIKEDTYALTAKGIIDNLKKRNMEGFFSQGKKRLITAFKNL